MKIPKKTGHIVVQSDEHLLQCVLATSGCTIDELALANVNATSVVTNLLGQNIYNYNYYYYNM